MTKHSSKSDSHQMIRTTRELSSDWDDGSAWQTLSEVNMGQSRSRIHNKIGNGVPFLQDMTESSDLYAETV